MSERKLYPSDLSDEQWSLIEPVITAQKDRHRSVSGHQGAYLPHDLPPKSATYYYFAAWREDGTDQVIHELLRCQVRERARRSHRDQESDRRARIDQQRPAPTAPLPNPFVTRPPR